MTTATPAKLVTNDGDPNEAYPVPELFGEFSPAPDLERIGNALREKYRHDVDFNLPDEVTIEWLWKLKGKGGESAGKRTLGKCIKLSGLAGYGLRRDYAIWVAADHVDDDDAPLSRAGVEAVVYHELKHIDASKDEEDVITAGVRGHDVEMFRSEIDRYGFWHNGLVAMGRTVLQSALPGFDGREIPDLPTVIRPKEDVSQEVRAGSLAPLPDAEVMAGVTAAIKNLRPKKGEGIDSMTISAGGETVTLTAE